MVWYGAPGVFGLYFIGYYFLSSSSMLSFGVKLKTSYWHTGILAYWHSTICPEEDIYSKFKQKEDISSKFKQKEDIYSKFKQKDQLSGNKPTVDTERV